MFGIALRSSVAMKQWFNRTVLLLAVGCVPVPSARGALRPESILIRPEASTRITELSFERDRFPLTIRETQNGQVKLMVRVSGRFRDRAAGLLMNGRKVSPTPDDGNFEVEVVIRDASTVLEFAAVDPYGGVRTESVELESSPRDPVKAILRNLRARTSAWNVGLSIAQMSYSDSLGQDFSQMGAGAKLSYSLFVNQKRTQILAGNIYGTLLPLHQSGADTFLQLVAANLRYGLYLGEWKRWKAWIYGGYFFTTTFSSSENVGFRNLLGPQLYPTASLPLGSRRSLGTYFKVAPLYGLDFENRELATGISYTTRGILGGSHTFSIDYAQIRLNAGAATIQLSSAVLGYSYGF